MKRLTFTLLVAAFILVGCRQSDVPKDFAFSFNRGSDSVDTFKWEITKDLVDNNEVVSTKFKLDKDSMEKIYHKMIELDVMNIPTRVEYDERVWTTPFSTCSFTVRMNGQTKTLSWTTRHKILTPEVMKYAQLMSFIDEIVAETPAYKRLPERKAFRI